MLAGVIELLQQGPGAEMYCSSIDPLSQITLLETEEPVETPAPTSYTLTATEVFQLFMKHDSRGEVCASDSRSCYIARQHSEGVAVSVVRSSHACPTYTSTKST